MISGWHKERLYPTTGTQRLGRTGSSSLRPVPTSRPQTQSIVFTVGWNVCTRRKMTHTNTHTHKHQLYSPTLDNTVIRKLRSTIYLNLVLIKHDNQQWVFNRNLIKERPGDWIACSLWRNRSALVLPFTLCCSLIRHSQPFVHLHLSSGHFADSITDIWSNGQSLSLWKVS